MLTRLEVHREQFRKEKKIGGLIRLEELDHEEMALINASVIKHLRLSPAEDLDGFYDSYVQTLHNWGIMCPHPLGKRLYDGWRKCIAPLLFEESKWYHCGICCTSVINR